MKTDLDNFNEFLQKLSESELGIRKKIVILKRYLKNLEN